MYLRAFITPYFCSLKNENGSLIVSNETLMNEVSILQNYTTIIFPELEGNKLILKNIYRDATLYLHLLMTYEAK